MSDKSVCGGCGKDLPEGYAFSDAGVDIWIAPGLEERVCQGRYAGEPKISCAERARKKHGPLCPGCGSNGYDMKVLGDLCERCHNMIYEGKRAVKEAPLAWHNLTYALPVKGLQEEAARSVLRLLGQAACGRGAEVHVRDDWDVRVEVTKEQRAALEELTEALKALMEAARAEGQRRGQSLLMALAEGKLTAGEFDDQAAK